MTGKTIDLYTQMPPLVVDLLGRYMQGVCIIEMIHKHLVTGWLYFWNSSFSYKMQKRY